MKAWMMALIAGAARILKTAGPYTANAVFNVPISTSKIESITGRGASGSPAGSGFQYGLYRTFIVKYDSPEYGQDSTNQTFQGYVSSPVNYCDPPIYYAAEHATTTYCYNTSEEPYNYPATTGANTTAFGKVFPGGVGGPATPVTFTNVAVAPGSSQSLVVPSGGSITSFTYYE